MDLWTGSARVSGLVGAERNGEGRFCSSEGQDRFTDFSSDCARYLKPLLSGEKAIGGIIHLSNSGAPVWVDWGQFCLEQVAAAGIELKTTHLGGITMRDLPVFVAERPHYSALSVEKYEKLVGSAPRSWQQATADYIDRYLIPNITSTKATT